jgi:hypothetical protein
VEQATLIDSETGERVRANLDEYRTQYAERMSRFLTAWQSRCRALGIDYIRAVTSQPYHRVLERYLLVRARR